MEKINDIEKIFKSKEVEKYKEIIEKKFFSLFLKRLFDIILSSFLLIILSPVFLFFSIWIKLDSKGEIFYRQKRITKNGREFGIFKFRTMVKDADKMGSLVTLKDDPRISRVGKKLRKSRLDELPQLINIFLGDMTFVGTRPEVKKYVDMYSYEMYATLLLRAGVTSLASINYKDEDNVIDSLKDSGKSIDEIYLEEILPKKMKYNLEYIENFSFFEDIKIIFKTILAVIK